MWLLIQHYTYFCPQHSQNQKYPHRLVFEKQILRQVSACRSLWGVKASVMWREQSWQREKLKGDAVLRKAPAIPLGSSEARRQGACLDTPLGWVIRVGCPGKRTYPGGAGGIREGLLNSCLLIIFRSWCLWLEWKSAGRSDTPLQVAEFRES